MTIKNELITLNGRQYPTQDTGEGEVHLVVEHQQITPPRSLQLIIENSREQSRAITVDITQYLPAEVELITPEALNNLLEDIHLLCDIYWLDKVVVSSFYDPDIIQMLLAKRLGKRIIVPSFEE